MHIPVETFLITRPRCCHLTLLR